MFEYMKLNVLIQIIAKLYWCQIVRVPYCLVLTLGAKLSILTLGAKLSGAKLYWCQIVRCQIVRVPNCPVPNCPTT